MIKRGQNKLCPFSLSSYSALYRDFMYSIRSFFSESLSAPHISTAFGDSFMISIYSLAGDGEAAIRTIAVTIRIDLNAFFNMFFSPF